MQHSVMQQAHHFPSFPSSSCFPRPNQANTRDQNEERRPKPRKSGGKEGLRSKGGGPKGGARRNGARRVGGEEGWGPDLEKVRAPRIGVGRVEARRVGPRSVGARRVAPKISRFFWHFVAPLLPRPSRPPPPLLPPLSPLRATISLPATIWEPFDLLKCTRKT